MTSSPEETVLQLVRLAWADPHGGALLSSGGAFAMDMRALERMLIQPPP